MREEFKKKKAGDTLGARTINKLTAVARRVSTSQSGSDTYGRENTTVGETPWQQIIVEIKSEQSGGLHQATPLYYNPGSGEWEEYAEANQIDVDPSPFDAELHIGDRLSGWWHAQRGAFIPFKSSSVTGTNPPNPTEPTPDPVACGCGNCPPGVSMPGNPTQCCTSHLAWLFTSWPNASELKLKYRGPDQWGTEPFAGPECDLGSGTSTFDLYRWLMTASRIPGESELRLELVTDNGCPEKICAVYKMLKSFQCLCSNEFYLHNWNGIARDEITCVICVHPIADPKFVAPISQSCISLNGSNVEIPSGFSLSLHGFDGYGSYPTNVCNPGNTQLLSNNASGYKHNDVTAPVCCFIFGGGPQPCPPNTPAFDVNGEYDMTLGALYDTDSGSGSTGTSSDDCRRDSREIVCATYGPVDAAYYSVIFGVAVGRMCAAGPSGLGVVVVVPTFLQMNLTKIDEYQPGVQGVVLHVKVFAVQINVWPSPIAPYVFAEYVSQVLTIPEDGTQADVDAVFDNNIQLYFCGWSHCDDLITAAALVAPDVIVARSLSAALLSPTNSGDCDPPCEPEDSDLGEDDDDDPGGCCVAGIFFREMTETECGEAGGTWYDDVDQGATECEGAAACCLPDGSCLMVTAYHCENALNGQAQGEGSSCSGSDPCSAVDDSSASSESPSSQSESASSQSSQSASSISSRSSSISSQSASSVSSSISSSSSPLVPTGACCTLAGFDCQDDFTEEDCVFVSGTWHSGQTCAEIGIPC